MQSSCWLMCWFTLLICSCFTHCLSFQRQSLQRSYPPLYLETEWSSSEASEFHIAPSNPHFSRHDSDKQRLRGGLVKCQRMTMRLLKLQPAIWINVQKDSTCFPPPSDGGMLRLLQRDWHITDCHLPLVRCEKEEHVWLSWPDRALSMFTSVCVNTVSPDANWEHIRHSRMSLRPVAQRANSPPAEEGNHKTETLEQEQRINGTPNV